MITLKQAIELLDNRGQHVVVGVLDSVKAEDTADFSWEKILNMEKFSNILNTPVEEIQVNYADGYEKYLVKENSFRAIIAVSEEVDKKQNEWEWFCNSDRGKFCSLYKNIFTEYSDGRLYNIKIVDNSTKDYRIAYGAEVKYDNGGYYIKVIIKGQYTKLYVNRITEDLPYPPIHC